MNEAARDAEADSLRRTKRSAAVSLVLIAGAGATAFGLARLETRRRSEDVLVYRSRDACLADRVRSAQDCTEAEAAARAAYAATAPRYETLEDCERHHGKTVGCVPGATVAAAAQGRFLPVMAAFMMGRTPEQDLPVQPLYPHAPEEEPQHAHGGGGGYCTGAGGRVAFSGAGTRARVPASVARTTSTTPRLVARGGFGGTGRAVASASGHGSGGHGSGG